MKSLFCEMCLVHWQFRSGSVSAILALISTFRLRKVSKYDILRT